MCSFDPTKTISAPGSGGAILTELKKIFDHIKKMRYHGKNQITSKFDFLGLIHKCQQLRQKFY